VHRILTFITRVTGYCLRSLNYRFVTWTKPNTSSLLLGTLTDQARNKSELVAENALLRQQLIILRRQVKRPACTKTDRMLLVLLASMVRTWKQALVIVQPETLLRWHRQGFKLFWKYISRAASPKPRISPETVALIKEMARDNRRLRSRADPGRIAQIGHLRLQAHRSEVHEAGPCHKATRTDVEDVHTHPCPADLGMRRLSQRLPSSSDRSSPSSSSNCTRAE
jgi:hypothetical protein